MEQREHAEKIKWHPGFCGGIELELREYREFLDFDPEHMLSKEPLRMDMLIIKKKSDIRIDNPIAEIFRKHNVIEYKSPADSLSIDSFFKTIGYACLYKGLGRVVGEISEKELTVSIFRHTYPRKLFKTLKKTGAVIEKVHDGVYRVSGIICFPTQIVVTKELEKGAHSALKILTGKADEFEVRNFIGEAGKYKVPIDRQNADAVLQVSVSSNVELFERLRKERSMCVALNNLMKDELDAREARGEARGVAIGEARGVAIGEARGEARGVAIGEARGLTQGIEKLSCAVKEIRSGSKADEIKKKYGKEIWEAAKELA